MVRGCFGCSGAAIRSPVSPPARPPPPRRRTPTQAEIQAAKTIQRIFRGASTRGALRSGKMKRRVRSVRKTALGVLKNLPTNIKRDIFNRASILTRTPGSMNKRHAPKLPITPGLQQWLRTVHTNASNFPSNANYDNYLTRVAILEQGGRANKIKAILARYELLKPLKNYPNAAVSRSPGVISWRRRLETNFKRKYIPRHQNFLSSRELYAFLKTLPNSSLERIAMSAPTYG